MASATATLPWLHNRWRGVRAMATNREQGSAKLITKVMRLFTFLLSTTPRRPAMYPSSRPAKIGTSAFARIVTISIGLLFRPLCFEHGAGQNRSLSCFTRFLRLQSIAEINGAITGVFNSLDQLISHVLNFLRRRILRTVNMKQFVEKTKLRIVPNIVGQWSDRLTELFKTLDGAACNPCRSLLVHRVNHDAIVVKCQNPIGLVAVRKETAGECMANHQGNDGVTRESRRAIRICCCRRREKDGCRLLSPPICLALHIDDCDDRTLDGVRILLDNFANASGESVSLFETYLPIPRAGKTRIRISDDTEKSRAVFSQQRICCQYRIRIARHWGCLASQCAEPYGSANASMFAHRFSSTEPLVPQVARNSLGSH